MRSGNNVGIQQSVCCDSPHFSPTDFRYRNYKYVSVIPVEVKV